MTSMNDVLALVLGGGRGTRLFPLTKIRAKPAVSVAGKYRLIDIPISNCINSGIFKIQILTQFNSHSLHRHITQTYHYDEFHPGYVEILAAEQSMESTDWYQGTADALRKQLFQILSTREKYVLVLAGDHLYRMDYAAMADFHWRNNADVTVAVQPVMEEEASRLGILKRDPGDRISNFVEKPKDVDLLRSFTSRPGTDKPYLGSMGIYMFNTEVLVDLLNQNPDDDDFGRDIIPHAIQDRSVYGYEFGGYWRDIGTIRSFYEVNLELTMPDSPFNFYDKHNPVFTHSRYLPCSVVEDSHLEHVLLADGCRIQKADISHSVIGVRSTIDAGTTIRDSILMGADYYQDDPGPEAVNTHIGIGKNCRIEGAIIDKNACIGSNVVISKFPKDAEITTDNWVVRDGIVVVPKNGSIPDGTIIQP